MDLHNRLFRLSAIQWAKAARLSPSISGCLMERCPLKLLIQFKAPGLASLIGECMLPRLRTGITLGF